MSREYHLIQVWLHVIKEFGLVFAIHQTYLLDYQFCIVESKFFLFVLLKLFPPQNFFLLKFFPS